MIPSLAMALDAEAQQQPGWICGPDGIGSALAERLAREVAERRAKGSLCESHERLVREVSIVFSPENFKASAARIELLRSLCRTFNVEFKPEVTRSHRKFIGPVIAAVKRVMLPFLRALLGRTFLQQAEFNATVVKLLGELCNERKR